MFRQLGNNNTSQDLTILQTIFFSEIWILSILTQSSVIHYLVPKLKYDRHFDFLLSKSNNLIPSMYPIIHRRTWLSVINNLLIYKTIFSPTFFYAAPVRFQCAKKRLQTFQNVVLKIILNRPIILKWILFRIFGTSWVLKAIALTLTGM